MHSHRIISFLLGAAVLLVIPSQTPASQPRKHTTAYSISLSGFLLAKAEFQTEINGDNVSITGHFNSAGLAAIFKPAKGHNRVDAKIEGKALAIQSYSSVYTSGKETSKTDIQFEKGNVTKVSVKPGRKAYPDNWIAVTPEDLLAVADPVSGFILPGDEAACPRTVRVFDGETRMDLELVLKGTKPFKTEGFDDVAIVCGVKFQAKSGYRANREDYADLAKTKRIEMWFAKAVAVNAYTPVYLSLPIRYGQVTMKATRFGD